MSGSRHRYGHPNNNHNQNQSQDATNTMIEEQCDALTSALDDKVNLLKSGVQQLGTMIKQDIKTLNDIERDTSSASVSLQSTFEAFGKMLNTGGHSTICWLACFMVAVFILLYLILRSRY